MAVATHHEENALAEFTNLLFEQVLCFRLVAHHDGVLDGHFRGVCLERAVLRPEIDRFRVVRVEDDPPVLGDDGRRGDDVEDDKPGTEGLGEGPGYPEGFLRRFVEIGRVNERSGGDRRPDVRPPDVRFRYPGRADELFAQRSHHRRPARDES